MTKFKTIKNTHNTYKLIGKFLKVSTIRTKAAREHKDVDSKTIIKMIEADGWFLVSTSGNHHQFKHQLNKVE